VIITHDQSCAPWGIIANVRIAEMRDLIIGKRFDPEHDTDRIRIEGSIQRVWSTLDRHALRCKFRLTRTF